MVRESHAALWIVDCSFFVLTQCLVIESGVV